MKILIAGLPGSGKSTVAPLVAKNLNLTHIPETYDISWSPEDYAKVTISKYNQNSEGVFETDHHLNEIIFQGLEHKKLYGEYDFVFMLDVGIKTLKERIKKRNRPNFVEIELQKCETRFANYECVAYFPESYLTEESLIYVEEGSVDSVVKTISGFIRSNKLKNSDRYLVATA